MAGSAVVTPANVGSEPTLILPIDSRAPRMYTYFQATRVDEI